MAKITLTISEAQLLSDAVARCLSEDIGNYRMRVDFAFFKKKVGDLIGPQSPFAEVRSDLFKKYGTLSEDGQSYLFPAGDAEKSKALLDGLESAMSAKIEVPFPDLTAEKIEQAKLPLNASELAVLVGLGILKED